MIIDLNSIIICTVQTKLYNPAKFIKRFLIKFYTLGDFGDLDLQIQQMYFKNNRNEFQCIDCGLTSRWRQNMRHHIEENKNLKLI